MVPWDEGYTTEEEEEEEGEEEEEEEERPGSKSLFRSASTGEATRWLLLMGRLYT